MKGRRLADSPTGEIPKLEPGDYIKLTGGPWVEREGKSLWVAATPAPDAHCNLRNHTIVEHEDGTVSVSPSILITSLVDKREMWHGYLERGVWREC